MWWVRLCGLLRSFQPPLVHGSVILCHQFLCQSAWAWEHHPAGPQQDPAGGSLWVWCHIVEIVFISLFLTPSIRKTPHEDNIKVTRTSILKLSRREWYLQPQYAPNMSLHCNTDFSFVIALCLFSCGFGHVSSMDPLWRWTSTEQSWWMATAEL